MAILMVVSAIQFVGVACLMNHVILLLRPLKKKDWLLCKVKSMSVKMNLASQCTLSSAEERDKGCFLGGLIFSSLCLCWATLQRVTKQMVWLLTTQQPLRSFCTEIRRCGVILRPIADRSRHTKDCAAECRISSFTEKHTQGLFMILDYGFLWSTDIAIILKKRRRA